MEIIAVVFFLCLLCCLGFGICVSKIVENNRRIYVSTDT